MAINTKKHYKPDCELPKDYVPDLHYTSVFWDTDVTLSGSFLNLFSSKSYFVSRFFFTDFENALTEKLKETSFDIIQLEGVSMASYIPILRTYSRGKIVLRAHNIEYLIWERYLENEGFSFKTWYLSVQTRRLKNFELRALKDLDAIVSMTDVDQRLFEAANFQKPIYSCITGVDIEHYGKALSPNRNSDTIFHFAAMDWRPYQQAVQWFLDNCWKTILRECPETKLVLAGRNMPYNLLKLRDPKILVIENVVNSKEFFQEHDIMVVPLLSGSGLRIKIIEGMAYGKAIVSTSIGAEGINYTNDKNIMIADTPGDFVAAVVNLLRYPEKKLQIQNGALELAKQEFDNVRVVRGLVEFYNELIN